MPTIVVEREQMDGTIEQEELAISEEAEIRLNTEVITVRAGWDERFWSERPTDPEELHEMVDAGMSAQEIAKKVGIDPSTASRWLHRCGLV